MSLNCTYCKNVFTTKSSLNCHQKTAKYCLGLQNIEINNSNICDGCNVNFTKKSHLTRHVLICTQMSIKNLENQKNNIIETLENTILEQKETIIEQKQTIKDLQNTIEKLASQAISRSTTTKNTQINNYIQQLQPVTDDILKDNAQNLTIDHILKGPEGYAQYALEYPLKDRMLCVDYARRKVKFKDPSGNVITDPEMTNLATKFFISINDKNKELIIEYGNKLKENFGDEMDTIIQIFDYKLGVQKSSEGEKCDFHHDFVKQICSKTIME